MSETLRDLVVSLSLNSDNFTRNIKSINFEVSTEVQHQLRENHPWNGHKISSY